MAMILAIAALLDNLKTNAAAQASRAIYESVFEAISDGKATPDIGGEMTTRTFTDEVIRRVQTKLEVWDTLNC